MNKKLLIITSLVGATMSLTGCMGVNSQEKAIKSYEDVMNIAFNIKNDEELKSLSKKVSDKFDLIKFENEIKSEEISDLYDSIFTGEKMIQDYTESINKLNISFKNETVKYNPLNKDDFEIISNPKLYKGEGEYIELKNMYLIINSKPIEVQHYDNEKQVNKETFEFIMPMIIDNKGKVKAFTLLKESDREFIKTLLLDENGMAEYVNDIEQDKHSTILTDSFIKLSGLKYEMETDYAIYDNEKTGLQIFTTFSDKGNESVSLEIPSSNIDDKEFNNQLEIAMKKVGMGNKKLNDLNSKIEQCLTEKFQSKTDIKEQISKSNGFFMVDFYSDDDFDIKLTVFNAGKHDETISVEFIIY